ncbi:MAG: hypothetical protein HZB39_05785 [Planctomycetes bacterium]|nr:hypothetical protein [Planctomycetota bacterium]
MNTDDVRNQIDNTLSILASLQGNEPHVLRRAIALAADTLKSAREALKETDAELDVLTAPGRNAAEELVRLRKQLDAAQDKALDLEQRLAMLRQERDVELQVHAAEKKRLAELEKQSAQYEAMLLKDDDAFSKYLDRALDADEKKRGRRPPSR